MRNQPSEDAIQRLMVQIASDESTMERMQALLLEAYEEVRPVVEADEEVDTGASLATLLARVEEEFGDGTEERGEALKRVLGVLVTDSMERDQRSADERLFMVTFAEQIMQVLRHRGANTLGELPDGEQELERALEAAAKAHGYSLEVAREIVRREGYTVTDDD